MSRKMLCHSCGAWVEANDARCPDCGADQPVTAGGEASSGDPGGGQLPAGTLIGSFEVERLIGVGGMGEVYRARDTELDRTIALKVISPRLANDPRFRERFAVESRAAASIENPHVLPVYQAGEQGERLFLATRLISGGDLKELVRRRGRLRPEMVADLISQIASALESAHAVGLVHRDVKPANVLIENYGEGVEAFLGDFGLAKSAHESSGMTGDGELLGTVDYMAPEQISGATVGQRADIYALGCVAFELLAGSPPFRRDSRQATMMAQLNEDPVLPSNLGLGNGQAVAAALGRALAKDPGHRYPSSIQFAHDLSAGLSAGENMGTSISTGANTIPVESPRRSRAGRMTALVGVVAALLVVALAGGFILGNRNGEDPVSAATTPVVIDPGEEPVLPEIGTTGSGSQDELTTGNTGVTGTSGFARTPSESEPDEPTQVEEVRAVKVAWVDEHGTQPIHGVSFFDKSDVPWAAVCIDAFGWDPGEAVIGGTLKKLGNNWIPIDDYIESGDWNDFLDGSIPRNVYYALQKEIRSCADQTDARF